VFVFLLTGTGLVATPAPGSIFALLLMTPPGYHIGVLAGVTVSTLVTFLIASTIIKGFTSDASEEDLDISIEKSKSFKLTPSSSASSATSSATSSSGINQRAVIVFACDAGMGSSAMGASMLGRALKERGVNAPVKNYAINEIPLDADIVVTHNQLISRAMSRVPNAAHISVNDFMDKTIINEVIRKLGTNATGIPPVEPPLDPPFIHVQPEEDIAPPIVNLETAPPLIPPRPGRNLNVLPLENIILNQTAVNKFEAINKLGEVMARKGLVSLEYIASMLEREKSQNTYIGSGISIPHGTNEGRKYVKKTGMVFMQFKDGIDFDGKTAYALFGIASNNDDHLGVISKLSGAISNQPDLDALIKSDNPERIYNAFKS